MGREDPEPPPVALALALTGSVMVKRSQVTVLPSMVPFVRSASTSPGKVMVSFDWAPGGMSSSPPSLAAPAESGAPTIVKTSPSRVTVNSSARSLSSAIGTSLKL